MLLLLVLSFISWAVVLIYVFLSEEPLADLRPTLGRRILLVIALPATVQYFALMSLYMLFTGAADEIGEVWLDAIEWAIDSWEGSE